MSLSQNNIKPKTPLRADFSSHSQNTSNISGSLNSSFSHSPIKQKVKSNTPEIPKARVTSKTNSYSPKISQSGMNVEHSSKSSCSDSTHHINKSPKFSPNNRLRLPEHSTMKSKRKTKKLPASVQNNIQQGSQIQCNYVMK